MENQERKQKLESLLTDMILCLRSDFLKAGANPMDHWTQLESRCRAAAMQCETMSEWCSAVQRRLRISSLGKDSLRSLVSLCEWTDEHDAADDALDLITRNHALLIALARNISDEAKAAKALDISADKIKATAEKYGLMEDK